MRGRRQKIGAGSTPLLFHGSWQLPHIALSSNWLLDLLFVRESLFDDLTRVVLHGEEEYLESSSPEFRSALQNVSTTARS